MIGKLTQRGKEMYPKLENSKRHWVYLFQKRLPSAIYNFNLYGQNAHLGGLLREVVKKSGYFTVSLTVRGGGSATSALTVTKCENFDQFFQ